MNTVNSTVFGPIANTVSIARLSRSSSADAAASNPAQHHRLLVASDFELDQTKQVIEAQNIYDKKLNSTAISHPEKLGLLIDIIV